MQLLFLYDPCVRSCLRKKTAFSIKMLVYHCNAAKVFPAYRMHYDQDDTCIHKSTIIYVLKVGIFMYLTWSSMYVIYLNYKRLYNCIHIYPHDDVKVMYERKQVWTCIYIYI